MHSFCPDLLDNSGHIFCSKVVGIKFIEEKMKTIKGFAIVIFLITVGSFSGCYTQLESGGFNRPERDRDHSERERDYDNSYNEEEEYTEDYDTTMTDSSYYYEDDTDYTINNYYSNDYYRPFYRRYYSGYHPGISIGFHFGYSYYDYYYDPFWVSSPFWWDYHFSPYHYIYNPYYYPGYSYPYYWGSWGNYDGYKYRKNDFTRLRNNDGSRGSILRTRDTGSRNSGGVVSTSRTSGNVRDDVSRNGRDRTTISSDRNTRTKNTRDRDVIKRNTGRDNRKEVIRKERTNNDSRPKINSGNKRPRITDERDTRKNGEVTKPRDNNKPRKESTPNYRPPRKKDSPSYNPPPQREAPRYDPPSRNESPRSNPPQSRGGGNSGGSRGGNDNGGSRRR